ncbi:putative baseplate assembly protein [Sorangium sp. So ce117]|uniref:putative baseplate assembly protein n=1 Tax=Sorangium sp. So ce117 TaxID=3133277 RepID=UPI003F601575
MPFTPKNLDDRTFQDLFQEAKRRIPAYLPEWTDHNESDPGIALVQLFAWLAETSIFRLNQAPDERVFVSFLNLVGFGPAPARAAEAVVELAMLPGAAPVSVPGSALRLAAPGPDGGGEIPFEAEERVSLVGATLAAALVDDGRGPDRLDVTRANQRGDAPYAPFGAAEAPGGALYLGLDAGSPERQPVLVPRGETAEMQLYVRCEDGGAAPLHASTSLEASPGAAESGVAWEGRVGPGQWAPLQVVADATRGLRQSGIVRLLLTDRLQAGREAGDAEGKALFWIRAVATAGRPARGAQRVRYVALNASVVRQWRTHTREGMFPGSDGTPQQYRAVLHSPIWRDPERPPVVEVLEPTGDGLPAWREWTCVDDLATRRAGDEIAADGHPLRIFRVSDDSTGVVFGDGLEGMIPPRAPDGLRITYRSGGGAASNGAAALQLAGGSIPGLSGVTVRERPSGGADEEGVDEARRRAPAKLRALERAVTAADFEVIARDRAGVARASALNRYHPLYPHAPVTGAVTLVVVPPRLAGEAAPVATQAFLDEVARTIEPYRVLTAELFVVPPRYRTAIVDVEVEVANEADASEAPAAIAAALSRYLDPITGGSDGEGWPLGEAIAYGELLAVIYGARRIAALRQIAISLDGVVQPPCADVPLGSPLDVVASGPHRIRVRAPERRR